MDPEIGLRERLNFKEVPQFLKINQISLVYGPTSNKDQTFIITVVFSSYIEEYVDLVSFLGTLGACI